MPSPKDPTKYMEYIKKQLESHMGLLVGNKHPMFGKSPSEETRKKMSASAKLKPKISDETRTKMSINTKMRWADPEYRIIQTAACIGDKNPFFGKKHSMEVLEKMRNKHITKETREKMSVSRSKLIGDKCSNWKGGITPLSNSIRSCEKYAQWRDFVFARDNYRDCFSGVRGSGNLHAHHIIPLNAIIKKNHIKTIGEAMCCEQLWDINNGITMLDSNHYAYHAMWGDK